MGSNSRINFIGHCNVAAANIASHLRLYEMKSRVRGPAG